MAKKNILTKGDILEIQREYGYEMTWLEPSRDICSLFNIQDVCKWLGESEDFVNRKIMNSSFTSVEFNFILLKMLLNNHEL